MLSVPRQCRFLRRLVWTDVSIGNLSFIGSLVRAPEMLENGTLFEMVVQTSIKCGNVSLSNFRRLAPITRTTSAQLPERSYPVGDECVEFRLDEDEIP